MVELLALKLICGGQDGPEVSPGPVGLVTGAPGEILGQISPKLH